MLVTGSNFACKALSKQIICSFCMTCFIVSPTGHLTFKVSNLPLMDLCMFKAKSLTGVLFLDNMWLATSNLQPAANYNYS